MDLAVCPFCGEAISEACDHLVADWSNDPPEFGALGGGFSENEAFVDIRSLAEAIRDLHNLAVDELDVRDWAKRRDALHDIVSADGEPAWWVGWVDSQSYWLTSMPRAARAKATRFSLGLLNPFSKLSFRTSTGYSEPR